MSDHSHQQPGWSSPSSGQFANNQYGAQPDPGYYGGTQPPGPQKSGRRTGLVLGIIAAVAVLAIIAGGLWMVLSSDDQAQTPAADEAAAAAGESQDDGAAGGGEATAHGAVEAYLSSLAAGNFDEAFSYVQDDPRDADLTDQLIAHSLELAPLTGIEVEESTASADEPSDYVQFSYNLGDDQFSGEMHVVHSLMDEAWTIGTSAATTALSQSGSSAMPLAINGEPISAGEVDVLYGLAYEVGVEHENFTLAITDDDGVLVADDTWVSFSSHDLQLTSEAEEQWRSLILEDAEACLESTARQAGCGLDMPEEISGDQVIEDTIERSASTSTLQTLDTLQPRLDPTNPNLVMAETSLGGIEVDYGCDGPAGSGTCELITGDPGLFDRPVVDMTADEPEVVWE